MSLFFTFEQLGFQIDPLPPLNQMSLYILFFKMKASLIPKREGTTVTTFSSPLHQSVNKIILFGGRWFIRI